MLLPAIQYDPGTGPVTLNMTYPPVNKPGADELNAFRTDTFSDSGLRQSILSRIETYRTLEMKFVPFADLDAWTAFMTYAMGGGPFTFFPDANNTEISDNWSLSDPNGDTTSSTWAPQRVGRYLASFTLRMRKEIS